MKFSQRIGEQSISKTLQIKSINKDLQCALWNVFYAKALCFNKRDYFPNAGVFNLYKEIWANLLKRQLDSIPYGWDKAMEEIKEAFYKLEWFGVYDFVEFIVNNVETMEKVHRGAKNELIIVFNNVLEREFSAFRFINGILSPISNKEETEEIKTALNNSNSGKLSGVHEHIKTALINLSNKTNPDYRNSIKESISAVESLAKLITNDSNATLPQALKKINAHINLHQAQVDGFIKIYAYTSDKGGIRHSLTDEDNTDFEDAQYMLVSCSAFVNYLIMKAEKGGIKI